MTTYYRDFHDGSAGERSIAYCAKRGQLGHNTRRLRLDSDWTRVYFSPTLIDIDSAREAPSEDPK